MRMRWRRCASGPILPQMMGISAAARICAARCAQIHGRVCLCGAGDAAYPCRSAWAVRERSDTAAAGVGVTERAQKIFNALANTMPFSWDGPTIVVLDTVRIAEPYAVENLSSDDSLKSTRSADRIRMVLAEELKRL